jgi:competence transcription factor ComK
MKPKYKKSTISMEMILWVIRFMFLIVVVLSISFVVNYFITKNIDTFDLEATVFANNILLSKNLAFYDEDTGRLYADIIDLEKFKSASSGENLESEINFGKNKKIGAKISLKSLNNTDYGNVFYRKDFYEEKKVIVDAGYMESLGGAKSFTERRYALIKNGDSIEKGVVTIEVIIPNS